MIRDYHHHRRALLENFLTLRSWLIIIIGWPVELKAIHRMDRKTELRWWIVKFNWMGLLYCWLSALTWSMKIPDGDIRSQNLRWSWWEREICTFRVASFDWTEKETGEGVEYLIWKKRSNFTVIFILFQFKTFCGCPFSGLDVRVTDLYDDDVMQRYCAYNYPQVHCWAEKSAGYNRKCKLVVLIYLCEGD